MKLNEIVQNYQDVKNSRNEFIRDKIEKLSDDKERIDDLITQIKLQLKNSSSKIETERLQRLIKNHHITKKNIQFRINQQRKQIIS